MLGRCCFGIKIADISCEYHIYELFCFYLKGFFSQWHKYESSNFLWYCSRNPADFEWWSGALVDWGLLEWSCYFKKLHENSLYTQIVLFSSPASYSHTYKSQWWWNFHRGFTLWPIASSCGNVMLYTSLNMALIKSVFKFILLPP